MSSNLVQSPEALAQVLSMLLVNDNDIIQQAENALKPFLKKGSCLVPLLMQLTHAPSSDIRLHAALLIKRRLAKLYAKLSEHDKNQIKNQLLSLLLSEQEKIVGIAIAGCISSLAKCVFKDKHQMPELFQALTELSQHPNERMRSLNFSLLAQLAENVPKQLIPHTTSLCGLLMLGCQDSSSFVTVEAMKAATLYIEAISDKEVVMELKPVLTPILTVMSACLQNGDEKVVMDGLEVFDECCKMEYPLINDHLEMLVPFLINIVRSTTIEYPLKRSAASTFNTIIEYRPKLVGKKQLVGPCLEAFVDIIAQSRGSAAGSIFAFIDEDTNKNLDNEDEDDDEDEDMSKVAQSSINTMAINLPSKYFVQTALNICSQCINSPDPHIRKAGCAVLGIIVEGCNESIRPLLADMVPRVTVLYSDADVNVRECASFALGQLAEHCRPDILHYCPQIMPVILNAFEDPSDTVKGTTCYVVEMFVEHLDPPILRPYLSVLINKLVNLMQSSAKVSKEILLASIASTAVAAEKDFIPYLDGTVNLLHSYLFLSDEKQYQIRGRALECLGHLSVAVGDEHFRPYFDLGMQSVMQATQIDDETLKEYGYIYIANIARNMQHLFATYLPNLVPHLLQVILEDELTLYADSEDEDEDGKTDTVHISPGDDHEHDEDAGQDMVLNVEEGFVNTKKAAITAIGSLAEHAKEQFAGYLEMTMAAILDKQHGSFISLHESIRAESVGILHYFVEVAKAGTPELKDMKPVKGVVMNIMPGSPLATVLNMVMNAYIKAITLDEDRESVSNALEGIVSILGSVGQAVLMMPCQFDQDDMEMYASKKITPYSGLIADVIMRMIFEMLCEKLPCQQSVERVQHHEEDDDDHEKLVIDSAAELIAALPKYILPSLFIPYFDEFSKPLLRYAKPNRDYNSRSMVIGIYAEVILELGPDSGKYVEVAIPLIQQGVTDVMEGVRRNSAYAIAAIIQSHASAMSQEQILMFLTMLQPLCSRSTNVIGSADDSNILGADVDNALSAVCRMITLVPQFVPLPQVLPVLMDALPLRVDPEEGQVVYGCILSLISNMEATAMSNLPRLLHILGMSLLSESKAIDDEAKALIRASLKSCMQPSCPVAPYLINATQQLQDASIIAVLQQAMTA